MVRVRQGLTPGLSNPDPIHGRQFALGPDTDDEDLEDSIVVLGDDDPTPKTTKRAQTGKQPVNATKSPPNVSNSYLLSSVLVLTSQTVRNDTDMVTDPRYTSI